MGNILTLNFRVNPGLTFMGGQTFLFTPLGKQNQFVYTDSNHNTTIRLHTTPTRTTITGDKLLHKLIPPEDIHQQLSNVLRSINGLDNIVNYYQRSGLILPLKQPFEETLISFIISTNNNIKRIRRTIQNLKNYYYGTKAKQFFPSLEHIANTSPKKLKELGLGYRADYLHKSASILKNSNFYNELQHVLKSRSNNKRVEIFKMLQNLPGIGPKVADCIMTFSLGFRTTTPIDVWAYRYLTHLLNLPAKRSYLYYREKLFELFGENTAVVGQHLFEWIRHNYKVSNTTP